MKPIDDPFVPMAQPHDDFAALTQRPLSAVPLHAAPHTVPVLGQLLGFDLLEQPLVGGISACPGERIPARSTVPLRRAQVGHSVVLMFENGDPRLPLIMGVIEPQPLQDMPAVQFPPSAAQPLSVQADGQRQLIQAEHEVVLRCGDASITLTRAGKVIIKGHYILSRSSGVNKIKGAAVDIN
jgi:Domain of unknown function (DUF6484)